MSKGQFIQCDDCGLRFVPNEVQTPIGKVRQLARKQGWRYTPGRPAAVSPAGRDLCPAHATR